jgi:hypothetical protein
MVIYIFRVETPTRGRVLSTLTVISIRKFTVSTLAETKDFLFSKNIYQGMKVETVLL